MRAGPLIALALAGLATAALGVSGPGGAAAPGAAVSGTGGGVAPTGIEEGPPPGPLAELERAVAAEPRVASRATVTVGRSARGRPIRAVAINGQGEGPRVLVVGCIHGDECGGLAIAEAVYEGCPPEGDGVVVVPNLNPDGLALDSRLNSRGVDLNRNFGSGWRPIGVRGDPEHSGPRPFSEPEARLARRLIRALRPEVTIWFHQQAEPLVRAWGPSVAVARRYARLAGTPFHRLPWMAGTAPNWQNHRFAGTSSFVVELGLGPASASTAGAHARAVVRLARGPGREGA